MFWASSHAPTEAVSARRLQLLRSAACYAEYACLAGTWTPGGIERELDNKGNPGTQTKQGTSRYRQYLENGTHPKPNTVKAFAKRLMGEHVIETQLLYWAIHPIGILLTSTTLTNDEILDFLDALPTGIGSARSLLWDESDIVIRTGFRFEIPDDEENIEALVNLKSTEGFLALLGRLRLRQLQGQLDYVDLYENALVDCFAEVVASDPHLCLAKDAMLITFANFLDWQCGWNQPAKTEANMIVDEGEEFWQDIFHQIGLAQQQAKCTIANLDNNVKISDDDKDQKMGRTRFPPDNLIQKYADLVHGLNTQKN
ncbi:MAG: hypothetical protein ACREPB_16405 [Arenimonas sp.]